MLLQVAPCPNCAGAVVFGERQCRTCGQAFDYGASAPPAPSTEQVVDALRAVGVVVDAPAPLTGPAPAAVDDEESIFAAVGEAVAAVRPSMGQGAASPALSPRSSDGAAPAMAASSSSSPPSASTAFEIDTGRFDAGASAVDVAEVPGLVDSTLFASMAPDDVDVDMIADLELTAVGTGAEVAANVTRLADLETLAVGLGGGGGVSGESIPGLFHSDVFHTDVDVAAGAAAAGELLEVSPSGLRARRAATRHDDGELSRAPCPSCGTVHAQPRCPNCATVHPHEPAV
jgi:hypothetical protein